MKYRSVVSETIVLVFSVAALFFTVDAPAANAQAHERHEQERAALLKSSRSVAALPSTSPPPSTKSFPRSSATSTPMV